ncbi:MAG TPA: class F sortase [Pseudonocardia sp.]|jgi:LPXTG-site transpeptidase (sortase) family protein|nr:class F sortase [Pseudonocardia sp.]
MRVRIAALAALLLVLATGCGGQPTELPDGPTLSAPSIVGGAVTPIPPLPAATPLEVRIDAINAESSLEALGLNPDQTVAVPPVTQPKQASWYKLGPTPGAPGPAVILGHINGGGEPGIFSRLHELKPGDQVKVSRADGKTALFTVTKLEQVKKDSFPTLAVYGDTTGAELRLITCGGSFDRTKHSYIDNIIVYAALTGVA